MEYVSDADTHTFKIPESRAFKAFFYDLNLDEVVWSSPHQFNAYKSWELDKVLEVGKRELVKI